MHFWTNLCGQCHICKYCKHFANIFTNTFKNPFWKYFFFFFYMCNELVKLHDDRYCLTLPSWSWLAAAMIFILENFQNTMLRQATDQSEHLFSSHMPQPKLSLRVARSTSNSFLWCLESLRISSPLAHCSFPRLQANIIPVDTLLIPALLLSSPLASHASSARCNPTQLASLCRWWLKQMPTHSLRET